MWGSGLAAIYPQRSSSSSPFPWKKKNLHILQSGALHLFLLSHSAIDDDIVDLSTRMIHALISLLFLGAAQPNIYIIVIR